MPRRWLLTGRGLLSELLNPRDDKRGSVDRLIKPNHEAVSA